MHRETKTHSDIIKILILKLNSYYDTGKFSKELYFAYLFFLTYTLKDEENNPDSYRGLSKSMREIMDQSRTILDKIGGDTKEIRTREIFYHNTLKSLKM